MPRALLVLSIALAATACATSDDDTTVAYDGPAGTGKLALTFWFDEAYAEQWDPSVDTARGPVWGTVWNADDVTGLGPNDGAVGLADFHVADVDLTDGGGPSAVLFTTEPIALADLTDGWVTLLGFLDSDGNAIAGAEDPDVKDPVTLPGDNEVQVVEGATTTVQVKFGLLSP